jgi:predicted esterase
MERAPRKIPMAIWVGTADPLFPVMTVRRSQAALNAAGFNAQLTEIKGHTHDYYSRAADINKQVWAFLKDKKLTDAPQFQQYRLIK